ncbi:hypothetical protein MRX96_027055 [Rhipicephalus microplus]
MVHARHSLSSSCTSSNFPGLFKLLTTRLQAADRYEGQYETAEHAKQLAAVARTFRRGQLPNESRRTPSDLCVVQSPPSWYPSKLGDTGKSSTDTSKFFLGYEEVASGQKPVL